MLTKLFPSLHGNSFREKRFALFLDLLERTGKTGPIRILDLGGTQEYWDAVKPLWQRFDLDITIVNLDAPTLDDGSYHVRPGNACRMDAADDSFDIVHSNSVIEHVGDWANMKAMAREVRRLAPLYYVQVPHFWFFMEPHFRVPFFHWLPESTRARMMMRKRRGLCERSETMDDAMELIQSARLLTMDQMHALFPDAQLHRERVAGMTKSIVAVRDGRT